MKNYKYILIVLLSVFLAGCFSNKYIGHNQYLLDTPNIVTAKHDKHACSVFVESTDATAPFDQTDFLYRTGQDRYLIDYYNGFLVSPSKQLDSILRAYFKNRAKFNLDVTEDPTSNRRITSKLVEFYADYRDSNNPQAVVAIQFVLTDMVNDKVVVLLDKVFRSSISLKAKTTAELLRAWNAGIKDLLQSILNVLNRKINC